MKHFMVVAAALVVGCQSNTPTSKEQATMPTVNYTTTEQRAVIDTYHGVEVTDPYRWLEDDRSDETADWVKRQNEVTQSYLSHIPYRQKLADRLEDLFNYERYGHHFKKAITPTTSMMDYKIIRFYTAKIKMANELYFDPNTFSEDGTTSLSSIEFSPDGSLAAYLISEGGSDWRQAIVIDTNTKKQLEAPLVDIKFSGISWKGNEGFFYSSYDKPKGSELSAKTDQHKLYFHTLGQAQTKDTLVFGGTESEKHRYVSAEVTDDQKFLMIYAQVSTSGNKLFYKRLDTQDTIKTILDHTDSDTYLVDNKGDTFTNDKPKCSQFTSSESGCKTGV